MIRSCVTENVCCWLWILNRRHFLSIIVPMNDGFRDDSFRPFEIINNETSES
jgi:hypothetical protein